MKNQILFITLIGLSFGIKAQNTFPTNGNVGIGTTTPSEKLHVNGNILSNKLMVNDPNRTIDWNTIWQSGFYESYNATNGPESGGWFWGLNMNHVSNSSTYKYNGQIAIKNSSSSPTMYFRSTNRFGTGTWAKIITDIGNKVIISGNVGIGTTNPQYKLHVNSGVQLRKTTIGATLASAENSWIRDDWLTGNYGPPKWNQATAKWVRPGGTNNDVGGVIFQDEGTYFIRDNPGTQLEYTNNEFLEKAYLFAHISTGNIGIGTTNPQYKLHVNSGVQLRKTSIGATKASSENSWIRDDWLTGCYGPPKWNQATAKWVRPGGTYNDVGGIIYQDEGTYFIRDGRGTKLEYTNNEFLGKAFMFADINNGNLGIGTNTPDSGYKLTVKGKIWTREVKVTSTAGGADFVFENTYKLPTLEEVEQFITENKHLPEIASAKEMEENGIHLAEMNIKLLQKIEELTLYTIQQQKELEVQQEKNTTLEARMTALEAHLKN